MSAPDLEKAKRKNWRKEKCPIHGKPWAMRLQYDMKHCNEPGCWDNVLKGCGFVRKDVFDLECLNGDAIMSIRADLKERFDVEAAFFDDAVALALQKAYVEGHAAGVKRAAEVAEPVDDSLAAVIRTLEPER